MGFTSIGWKRPATQRDRMEAVSGKTGLLFRVVLRPLQNDPSQTGKFMPGDSRRASRRRRAAPVGAFLSKSPQ